MEPYVIPLQSLRLTDVHRVGGKNASLGEMIGQLSALDVRVPGGFATTAHAYREFLGQDELDTRIDELLRDLDVDNIEELTRCGKTIRDWILATPLSPALLTAIEAAWTTMGSGQAADMAVAVRSSATAEDLPEASFAGQQETFLNIRGLPRLIEAIHHVFASLYNDRAIAYRVHQNFDHKLVALSVGVQHMVRSDLGASGVMFTLDTESGFRDVVFITSAWGLGETVVQGAVNPDEFYVYKPGTEERPPGHPAPQARHQEGPHGLQDQPELGRTVRTEDVAPADSARFSLTDHDVETLARQAAHHRVALQLPDGYRMGQGRKRRADLHAAGPSGNRTKPLRQYAAALPPEEAHSNVIVRGRSIGQRIGAGPARIIASTAEMGLLQDGDVLVADMTDPDWEPVMKRASAIVTNRGGRTCHAAIIARELGIPAVVGCGDATRHDQGRRRR